MIIFLNGRLVPEKQAVVSVFDRGFLYGDGLFETMRVVGGKPFRWEQHLARLQHGAEFLKIKLPYPPEELRGFAGQLITENRLSDALLRLTLSRGIGARGYSPRNALQPTCVMTLQPGIGESASQPGLGAHQRVPASGWKLITAKEIRLPPGDPLARFKTANKLWQVLARAEADTAGADEALLLNTDGHVAEAASANVFWLDGQTVCTPPLSAGILPGVTRAVVMEIARAQGLAVSEKNVAPEQLAGADGAFLTLSSRGVVAVTHLDGQPLRISPVAQRLAEAYGRMLESAK